jgi:predicted nucleic acid-binding protein
VKKYVVDTHRYIAAARSHEKADELTQYYSAFLPFTHLHAIVAQEFLAGVVDARRGRQIQESYIAPFEDRKRIVAASYRAWKRSPVP